MRLMHCHLHLDLPHIETKKGRRAVLNALKSRLKTHNLSVLDVSGEYVKEADLVMAYLALDAASAARQRDAIEALLERHFCEFEYELVCEAL